MGQLVIALRVDLNGLYVKRFNGGRSETIAAGAKFKIDDVPEALFEKAKENITFEDPKDGKTKRAISFLTQHGNWIGLDEAYIPRFKHGKKSSEPEENEYKKSKKERNLEDVKEKKEKKVEPPETDEDQENGSGAPNTPKDDDEDSEDLDNEHNESGEESSEESEEESKPVSKIVSNKKPKIKKKKSRG